MTLFLPDTIKLKIGDLRIFYESTLIKPGFDAEKYVYHKLTNMGYRCITANQSTIGLINKLMKKDAIIFKEIKYCNGIPDYICWSSKRPHKYFWIEVKRENDGLRLSQLEWIISHPEETIILFYVLDAENIWGGNG